MRSRQPSPISILACAGAFYSRALSACHLRRRGWRVRRHTATSALDNRRWPPTVAPHGRRRPSAQASYSSPRHLRHRHPRASPAAHPDPRANPIGRRNSRRAGERPSIRNAWVARSRRHGTPACRARRYAVLATGSARQDVARHSLAQKLLVDLASRAERDLVHHHDVVGHPPARDLAVEKGEQLGPAARCVGVALDQ
jgi:hypothetical protein